MTDTITTTGGTHIWIPFPSGAVCERCGTTAFNPCEGCGNTIIDDRSDHAPGCKSPPQTCPAYAAWMNEYIDSPIAYIKDTQPDDCRCKHCRRPIVPTTPVISDLSSDYSALYCSSICLLVDNVRHQSFDEGVYRGREDAANILRRIIIQETAPGLNGQCCRATYPHNHCIVCKRVYIAGKKSSEDFCDYCAESIKTLNGKDRR